jgi:tetratricopeptide (TPR) repeat protein
MAQHCNRFIAALLVFGFILTVCAHAQERKVPSTAGEWNVVGMGLALQDRWPEAIEAFQKAVKLQPSFVQAHNNLGFALATLGRSTEAIKAFQLAIRVKPHDPNAYYNLGFTYETMGKWREAADVFQEALTQSPRWDLAVIQKPSPLIGNRSC